MNDEPLVGIVFLLIRTLLGSRRRRVRLDPLAYLGAHRVLVRIVIVASYEEHLEVRRASQPRDLVSPLGRGTRGVGAALIRLRGRRSPADLLRLEAIVSDCTIRSA